MTRIYKSIFENRELEAIRADYYSKKWISKSELCRLFEYEKEQLVDIAQKSTRDYNDLLESFNLNAMRNFNTGLTNSLLHNKKIHL